MTRFGNGFYTADDGMNFNTEKDCNEYEKNTLFPLLKGKKFDNSFNPVDDFSKAYYFILSNDKDIEDLHTLNKIYNVWSDIINGAGFYYHDPNSEKYVNLSEVYQKILELAF